MKGMKKMGSINKKPILLVLMSLLLMLALVGCASSQAKEKEPMNTGLDPKEWNSYAFKDKFPLHWESFMKNMVDEKEVKPKNDPSIEPYLPILWNGFGFAVEYNLTRGHTYAFEDQMEVRRITMNPNAISACMSCKTTLFPQMIEEFGYDNAFKLNYHEEAMPWIDKMTEADKGGELGNYGHASVGCSTCHDPVTMDLRISMPQLTLSLENMDPEVMKKQLGFTLDTITQHDMRSLVCAQCHVEYYFDPANDRHTTFPWTQGVRMDNMWDHYEEIWEVEGQFQGEYVSRLTNQPILKAQHPEYELWSYGPHQTVSCSDCHMPYQRVDGKKKISSHRWGSPLKTVEESCRTCHADKSQAYLKDRVKDIQTTHKSALLEAQEISVQATYYVNRMMTRELDPAKIKEAQYLLREGQWFWDIIAAENSKGFHNPQGAMDSFRRSITASSRAIELATIELMKAGENIEELKQQIEITKQNVINETVNHEKHKQAINEWFPNHRGD
ncbi:ammonia-forming cytochrome c nitrite reductase subunit c552 [Anaerobacillus alkaliphilus]|uniref:nitrite reductase (cytochrome; ammonia-forming) n=1 Tax=Anaerobacillus alkaliphilus TaxID=1548597 RepID=A0A4V1LGG2_9BACI|nr:ammonia-forming cytochrome c nitrite reductase subunit c552 [Anaerobacillus alkaliphilus]RXJ01118.1 ammonia-forming cytochrome c nitrite reductase subunit c552 [Anaerobacillus alkaliphilus]